MIAKRIPDVSVVLPCYNAGDLLAQAVDSILTQSHRDLELIIVDDGSKDGAIDALGSRLSDERVVVIRQNNQGLAAALNNGIEVARAALICRMDADDVARPTRVSEQLAFLQENSDAVLVGTQIRRYVNSVPGAETNFPLQHKSIVEGLVARRHVMCHPSVMFRKSVWLDVGGYWSQGVAEDWDFFLKLSRKGTIANLDSVLLNYRFHSEGINVRSLNAVRWNMRLAIRNYRLGNGGLPEIDSARFRAEAGISTVLSVWLESRSLTYYRRSLLSKHVGKDGTAMYWLFAAALCWPSQAVCRVWPVVLERVRVSTRGRGAVD